MHFSGLPEAERGRFYAIAHIYAKVGGCAQDLLGWGSAPRGLPLRAAVEDACGRKVSFIVKTVSKIVCLLLASSLAACAAPQHEDAEAAEQGASGIEFATVAVPGQNCNSIVLKGTRRFQGRAYVLPQAYVGVDANTKPLFQLVRNADNTYSVRLGIFFPGGTGDREQRADNNRRIKPDCTYDRIREVVNQNANEAERISDPTPLVVNHIKAKLAGADGVAMIGHEGTDILSYVGQDAIVEFKISTEAQLRDFLTRLRGSVGVQLDVDFVFMAQTSDTFEATVDFRANADKLDGAFAGSNIPAGGAMVDAEFKARLARAIQTMDLDIYVESSNDAFTQFAERIIDKLLLSNPDLQIRPPALPPGIPEQNNEPPPAADPTAVLPKFKVAAALEALKAQATYTIKLTNIGEAAKRVYTTHTVIRSNFTEPGVSELALYSDDQGSVFTGDIAAGTSLFLVPSGRATEDLEYHYRQTSFTTKEDLFNPAHNMGARFNLLSRYPGSVSYPGDGPAYMYDGWAINVFNWSHYTWGFETLVTDVHNRQFTRLEPGSISSMSNVGISFSRVGRLYTFSQLAEETDLWEAQIEPDKNRVYLKAKSELGRLKLENKEAFAKVTSPASNANDKLYERRYYQDYWSTFGSHKSRSTSAVGQPLSLPKQRSAYYVKVIPERGDLQAVNERGIDVVPSGENPILHPPPAAPNPEQ